MANTQLTNEMPGEQQQAGFDKQCQQLLYAIGSKLAAAREKQKSVLENISKDLKIRSSLLRAIEQGNIDEFPGDSYYYGFARNYAKSLAVDISDEIKEYRKLREKQERSAAQPESRIMNVDSPIANVRSDRSKIAAATIVSTTSVSMMNDNSRPGDKPPLSAVMTGVDVKMRGPVVLAGIGFIIVLLYALWTIAGLRQPSSDVGQPIAAVSPSVGEEAAESEELAAAADILADDAAGQSDSVFRLSDNVVQAPEETDPVKTAAAASSPRRGQEYGSPVNARVWVQATTGSWVSVVDVSRVDIEAGQTGEIFARQLKPNDIYYVPPGDQIFVKAGNAGGVRLVVDNKPQDPLGRNGQVRYSSLDAESVLLRQNFVYGAKLNELLQAVKRAQSR